VVELWWISGFPGIGFGFGGESFWIQRAVEAIFALQKCGQNVVNSVVIVVILLVVIAGSSSLSAPATIFLSRLPLQPQLPAGPSRLSPC
jgi:hypothetical protein